MVYAIQVSLREDIVACSGRYTDEYEEEIRHRQVQDQQVSRVPHARVALHLGGILVLEDMFRFFSYVDLKVFHYISFQSWHCKTNFA